jgi:hypothetical protein
LEPIEAPDALHPDHPPGTCAYCGGLIRNLQEHRRQARHECPHGYPNCSHCIDVNLSLFDRVTAWRQQDWPERPGPDVNFWRGLLFALLATAGFCGVVRGTRPAYAARLGRGGPEPPRRTGGTQPRVHA